MTALETPQRAYHSCFNCRVYERLSCELPVACQPAAAFGREESRWPGTIRDVSQGGVRLTLERRYEPGTGLAVELPHEGHGESRTVLVKVIHVKRQSDGQWSLGCKFISELGEDEVRRIVPHGGEGEDFSEAALHKPTQHTEPRTLTRVRLQVTLASGTLLDCLATQMVVPPNWPLAAGKTVTLRSKSGDAPWKLQIRIAQCAQQKDGWVLRGRLLNAPSTLHLFRAIGANGCHETPV